MLTAPEWAAVGLSLKVGLAATLVTLPIAYALAYVLARRRFPGRGVAKAAPLPVRLYRRRRLC